jgi:hydrogenase/urease accessory protein HupE
MKPTLFRRLSILALFAAPLLAHAHPGHDGDHDFVWDFEHVASHPFATLLCLGVAGAAIWGVRSLVVSRRAAAKQRIDRR